jgi:hypothetical protein
MTTTQAIETGGGAGGFRAMWPSTKLGKWGMWLAVAFVVLFVVNMSFVGIFGRSTDSGVNQFSQVYMPSFGIAWLLIGLASGVVGIVAVLKQKERSIVSLIALLPGLFCVFLLLGEFLVPH